MSYRIVLDTETCPYDETVETVLASNQLPYDISWIVVNDDGEVFEQRRFAVAETFLEEKELLKNAFFADKIPSYWEQIKRNECELKKFANIRKQLIADVQHYFITEIYAFNSDYDETVLNVASRWFSKSKYRYFLPNGTMFKDIMALSKECIFPTEEYQNFCFENGFITKHKNPRARNNAEVVFRYITNNLDFEEEHKGLDDCFIEKEIMVFCLNILRQKPHNMEDLL